MPAPQHLQPLAASHAPSSDADDLSPLIDAHHAECLSYAVRMLGNRADAEDAVQDTWFRVLRALDRYDPGRPFRPWLFRILVNTVRSHLRRRRYWWNRRSDDVDPDALESAAPSSDAPPDRLDALRAAVAELPNPLREAFLLKYVANMSYAEIAEATGANPSALKMRVKRACDALRPQLQEDLFDDE